MKVMEQTPSVKASTSTEEEKSSTRHDSSSTTPAINGPLVFSCGKCHTIIGDSLSLVGTHAQLKTLTLSAASKVTRNESLITSQSSIDKGSTFVALMCYNCSKILGRYYITTPRTLDDLREKFTFFVDDISSYELGRPEYGENQPNAGLSGLTSSNSSAVSEEVEVGLLKVQHVILGLEERIRRIEDLLQVQPPLMPYEELPTQIEEVGKIKVITSQALSALTAVPLTSNSQTSNSTNIEESNAVDYWTADAGDSSSSGQRKKARR